MTDVETIKEWSDLWGIVHEPHEADEVLRKLHDASIVAVNDCRKEFRQSAVDEVSAFRARMDELHQEVRNAYGMLRSGVTKAAAIAECRTLVEAAQSIMDGKYLSCPAGVVSLELMDSECVTKEDADTVAALHEKVVAMVAATSEAIRVNTERLDVATGKTVEDASLVNELSALHEKRNEAVLAGADTSQFDKKIIALKGRMDTLAMAQKLAAGDVELLRQNDVTLRVRMAALESIEARLACMDAAFKCHSMVGTLNSKIEELHALVERFVELQGKAGHVSTPYAYVGHDKMVWPIFRGCWMRPDGYGRFVMATDLPVELEQIF